MTDPNTITIPADLRAIGSGEWGPSRLRRYADTLTDGDYFAAADLCRYLADQIEAQTKPPRPEGWYHVNDGDERVLWWGRGDWSYSRDCGDLADISPGATISPVTIGDPS